MVLIPKVLFNQSKGPARKALLLKLLIQLRMPDCYSNNCDHDHLCEFFDIMDKLSEMEINTDDDLITVMVLYNLSSNYENFHCVIKSGDELQKPEVL